MTGSVIGVAIAGTPIGAYPICGIYQFLDTDIRAKACFHWKGTVSSVGYWTEPSTSVTFATPKIAYVLSVGPKKFKQVQ